MGRIPREKQEPRMTQKTPSTHHHPAQDLEPEDVACLGECVRDLVAHLGYGVHAGPLEAVVFREAIDAAVSILTLRQAGRASLKEFGEQRGDGPPQYPPITMAELAQDIISRSFASEEGWIDIISGTSIGGKAAATTNKLKYGLGFYKEIGALGGAKGTTGGYWYKKHVLGDIESIRNAGRLGGRISRRGPNKLSPEQRQKIRREVQKAYEELMTVHTKAKRERAVYAQTSVPRLDEGAITVFDRKRGLVREAA